MQQEAITDRPESLTYLPPALLRRGSLMLTRKHEQSTQALAHRPALRDIHHRVSGTNPERQAELPARYHWFHVVPLEQLQVLFTFFSKFFSPFVHTTSSLSVSQEYLALDEIYHLFRAAIPNNPTREKLDTY